ncbi:Protein of unknown function [Pseudoxanthomonas sp. CF385]|uniref:glycosyltransferase 87 family protein n=1 Tax=Pseudoxanthomonas sp. CF385 TaxID=1881042 RepID=UPI00088052DB|nr:glycosyltransferase 87 family protein [Pseudoxanthomonas sp. CF385]SDQ94986.1 Protein of unknown function [Pseudoxanthomonas sp. CF385]
MKPRAELVLASGVLAFALAMAALVFVGDPERVLSSEGAMSILAFALPAALSAALAAWVLGLKERRARTENRAWRPGGMTLRVVASSFLMYAILSTFAMLALASFEDYSLLRMLREAATFAGLVLGFAIVLGAVPAFVLEYFVCRRYLRRVAVAISGTA